MKAHTPEGREILLQHQNMRDNYIEGFKKHKSMEIFVNDIERLTFVTLRRFRALHQWPYYDILEEDDSK